MGIQMNPKDLTKKFIMISNWAKLFGFHALSEIILAL